MLKNKNKRKLINPIVFENVETVDDIFKFNTSKPETSENYEIGGDGYKHYKPSNQLNKYLD